MNVVNVFMISFVTLCNPAFVHVGHFLTPTSSSHRQLQYTLCTDTCSSAKNNICSDGGANSVGSSCAYGTDCTDCSYRSSTGAWAATISGVLFFIIVLSLIAYGWRTGSWNFYSHCCYADGFSFHASSQQGSMMLLLNDR